MRILSEEEIEVVSGGTTPPPLENPNQQFLLDQFFRYKMGLSSIFD
jgi:hypothetical protein